MASIKFIFEQLGKLFTWWVTVYPWEQAVRVKWGKHLRLLKPGIHIKVPLMHQVVKQNVRLFVANAPRQTLTTLDGKLITLSTVVGYRIVDIKQLYMSVQDPQDTIINMVLGATSEVVAALRSEECTPNHIIDGINTSLGQTKWGLEFTHVYVNDFARVPLALRLVGDGEQGLYTTHPNLDKGED